MPVDIKSILAELKTAIVAFAKKSLKEFAGKAAADAKKLLSTIKEDLARWTQLLADGQLTRQEFETLLLGKKDLIEMSALTEAGLALVRIDDFKDGLLHLIFNTITSAIKL